MSVFKVVTTMLRQCDLDDSERDGSRYLDSMKSELMKALTHKGARDFDDGH